MYIALPHNDRIGTGGGKRRCESWSPGEPDHPQLICNLGSGNGFSVREIIEVARGITGKKILAKEIARRPGDAAVLIASSEKAKRLLGWNPQHSSIEDIVRSAWNWHSREKR